MYPVGKSARVNLDISVALSELALQTPDVPEEATNDEKMHSLRIIVVRPDNRVEDNRFLEFSEATERYEYETFKVAGNETKRIYLFVNEHTTIETEATSVSRKLIDYDLAGIFPGQPFPEALADLTIQLNDDSEQIAGPLPMSDCHTVKVADTDAGYTLFVTRAAVKFSFRIINRGHDERRLSGIAVDKMARKAYLLPKDVTHNDRHEIVDYRVPAIGNNEYYTFEKETDLSLPAGTWVSLDPIYLLEGKYTDADSGGKNYRMSVLLDGEVRLSDYFPDLAQLPRNTHVVVNVTINDSRIDWQVDLVPYGEVVPDPVIFGL